MMAELSKAFCFGDTTSAGEHSCRRITRLADHMTKAGNVRLTHEILYEVAKRKRVHYDFDSIAGVTVP